jgi:arylsulfatase A-like enzyme
MTSVAARETLLAGVSWTRAGLRAGAWLGALEATERVISLRAFTGDAFESLGLWIATLTFTALAGLAVGAIAAAVAGAWRFLSSSAAAVPAAARAATLGLLLGAGLGGWLLLALTLTTRFDRWIDRGPVIVLVTAVAGAVLAPALAGLAAALLRRPRAARAAAFALALAVGPLYVVNLLFAPQSSAGIHVMLDTVLVFSALFAARLLSSRPAAAGARRVWFAATILLVLTHVAMTASPRISSLAKTRGATSRRAIAGVAWLLDVDRDGWSPRWLTAGWDTAPFDPGRPAAPGVSGERSGAHRGADASVSTPEPFFGESAPGTAPRPHVLLITIDALRADAARGDRGDTPLGALRPPTPTLDSLARASATFTSYSPSAGTEDTFASLFSGGGLPGVLAEPSPDRWLPRRLAAAGYRLAAFVDYPFAPSLWGWPLIATRPPGDAAMGAEAIDALAADTSAAFVWIHWMPLHGEVLSPFSPQSYFAASQRRRYADGLARVDAHVGGMLARLRAAGLAERTLVILSADHGEELGEHGHYHHNLSLFEPAVRVPLWVSGPGVVAGERGEVVEQRDLHPTLLEVAGVDAEAAGWRSLRYALADPGAPIAQRMIYTFLPQRGVSRRHSWIHPARGQAALLDPASGRKVILDFGRERVEAYDLRVDPLERLNLAGRPVPWVAPMRAALDSALRVHAAPAN